MKIGVITYFNIKNYGSALQAYSLKTVSNMLGHDVVFLNVKEGKTIYKIAHKLHVGFVTFMKCLMYSSARITHTEIRNLRNKSESGYLPETIDKFNVFLDGQLPNMTIDRLSLRKVARSEQFGAFICGSDQIWSPLSVHLSGYKYLDFAPRKKRIAYAPSFGVESVPGYNRAFVRKKLLAIDDISVREKQGARIVKELTGKEVPVLLDPTMLMSGDAWRSIYKAQKSFNKTKNYALCYFFDEPSAEIIDKIVAYAKECNLKIIVLSGGNAQLLAKGAELVDAGPWEFLRYIDEAECVFTNSFHGSVFSILFGKPLKIFGRHHSEAVKQTSRIDTLLEIAELKECMYHSSQDLIDPTDTKDAGMKIVPYRDASLKYIKDALDRRTENE